METALGLILTGLGAIITAFYTGRSQLSRKRDLDQREALAEARAAAAENEQRYRATRKHAVVLEELLQDARLPAPERPPEMHPTWSLHKQDDDSGGGPDRKAVPA
jgi:hypothetical protein